MLSAFIFYLAHLTWSFYFGRFYVECRINWTFFFGKCATPYQIKMFGSFSSVPVPEEFSPALLRGFTGRLVYP